VALPSIGRDLHTTISGLQWTVDAYTLVMASLLMLAGSTADRVGRKRTFQVGLVISGVFLAASGLMLTRISPTTPFTWLFTAYVVFGIGFGVVNAPITNTAVSGMPVSQAGVAAAMASTSRQIGQTLGVAVLGTFAAATLEGRLDPGLAHASVPGWWVIAACGALITVLAFTTTSPPALASAERAAAAFD
jgi:MFS family permease